MKRGNDVDCLYIQRSVLNKEIAKEAKFLVDVTPNRGEPRTSVLILCVPLMCVIL